DRGGGAARGRQRQKGNSPKPSGPNPMPTHAYHLRILNHCHLVLQTRYAFTSIALLVPVILAPSVAKKPHTKLNGGPRPLPPAFLRGFAALTCSAASPTERSMTRKVL